MKRAYREAAAVEVQDGFSIALDERPVRTAQNRGLVVPARALADAIASEWSAQGERLRPRTMPLTQLANTVIDRIAGQPEPVVDELAAYALTDLLCHRVDYPVELARRQTAAWQPLLDWCTERFGVSLAATVGVIPGRQDPKVMAPLHEAIAALNAWELAALALATHACGSIVLGLALLKGRLDANAAWAISLTDELYQAEQWGEDEEARRRRESIRQDIRTAAEFLRLLRSP